MLIQGRILKSGFGVLVTLLACALIMSPVNAKVQARVNPEKDTLHNAVSSDGWEVSPADLS